jgi:hypothetical protein
LQPMGGDVTNDDPIYGHSVLSYST